MLTKIFPDKTIAEQIAGVLSKTQGKPHKVEKCLTGYEVKGPPIPSIPIETFVQSGSMSAKHPNVQQIHKVNFIKHAEIAKAAEAFNVPLVKPKPVMHVQVTFPYKKDSPQYLVAMVDGKETWISKSNLATWEFHGSGDEMVVTMTMTLIYAKKREWLQYVDDAAASGLKKSFNQTD